MKLEILEQYILTENIPRDLLQAYKTSERSSQPSAHPESIHFELNTPERRTITFKYGDAEYTQISPDEAMNYLHLEKKPDGTWKCTDKNEFVQNLPNLRFLANGQVMEWEVKPSGTIYYTYWMYFPRNKAFTPEGETFYFKGKTGPTLDTKFANKYTDIANIAYACDKIYKTNEYDLLLSREEIEQRSEKGEQKELKRFMSSDHPDWDPHNMFKNYGRQEREMPDPRTGEVLPERTNTFKITNVPDTGSHLEKTIKNLASNSGVTHVDTYMRALQARKDLLRSYNNIRGYLKKLESEKDDLDQAEYISLRDTWKTKEQEVYKDYQNVTQYIRKLKTKTISQADSLSLDLSRRKAEKLEEVQKVLDKAYNLGKYYAQLKKKSDVTTGSNFETREFSQRAEKLGRERKLREINTKLKNVLSFLKETSEELEKINPNIDVDAIENLDNYSEDEKARINNLQHAQEELDQAIAARDEVIQVDVIEHLNRLKEIEQELKDLEDKIAEYRPIEAARKKAIKDAEAARDKKNTLDPALQNIVRFVPGSEL